MSERRKHFAVDKLSAQARQIIDDGLGAGGTYDSIIKLVKQKTGESMTLSSLQRYHANKWFPIRAALEQTEQLHGLVKQALEKSQGKKFDEATSEVAKAMLFKVVTALKDPDPYALYDLVLADGRLDVQKERNKILRERTDNDKEKIKLLERSVKTKEQQIEQAREKALVAEKKVEQIGKKKGLDADTLKRIREEIYGIVEAPA